MAEFAEFLHTVSTIAHQINRTSNRFTGMKIKMRLKAQNFNDVKKVGEQNRYKTIHGFSYDFAEHIAKRSWSHIIYICVSQELFHGVPQNGTLANSWGRMNDHRGSIESPPDQNVALNGYRNDWWLKPEFSRDKSNRSSGHCHECSNVWEAVSVFQMFSRSGRTCNPPSLQHFWACANEHVSESSKL